MSINENQRIIPNDGDGLFCKRLKDGMRVFNIPQVIIYHSPSGMEWGYSGSGPADLALNALYFYTKDLQFSKRWHQWFKSDFIAGIPKDGGDISKDEIMDWIEKKRLSEEPQQMGLV